jgi:hypothetical protein
MEKRFISIFWQLFVEVAKKKPFGLLAGKSTIQFSNSYFALLVTH